MQSKEEILNVANSWQRPGGLIDSEENGMEIAKGIDLWFKGVWSHANLDAVVAKLGSKSQGGKLDYNERVIERVIEKPAVLQTPQEAEQIRREWWKSAPKDVPYNAANDAALAAYIRSRFGGLTNITSLNEAAANASGLQRLSEAELAEARRKQEQARMQWDVLESYKPQQKIDYGKLAREAVEKEKWKKAQGTAKNELDSVIDGYSCNAGPNRVDHAASQMVRDFLRKVRVPAPAGKGIDATGTDYVATVNLWVRAVIQELPDHPRLGDPEKALQRVRDNFAAQAEAKARPDRNQGW